MWTGSLFSRVTVLLQHDFLPRHEINLVQDFFGPVPPPFLDNEGTTLSLFQAGWVSACGVGVVVGGGVSIRLLTVKLPHSEPALPTAGSVRSGGSILKGCVNTSEGWVGEGEGTWGVSPHP